MLAPTCSRSVRWYTRCARETPFPGETSGVIFHAILGRPPPSPSNSILGFLPKLEDIINKALEKDRELRYQNAADLRADLKRLKRDTESARHTSPVPLAEASVLQKPAYRRKILYGSVLAIVLLALGFGFRWFKGQQIAPHKTLSERQLTRNPSENRLLGTAISPDGKHVAYADTKGLHLSTVETGEVHDIPLPDELRTHVWGVAWFPDGEKLEFTAESETEGFVTWLTSVFGGVPRKLRIHSRSQVVSPQGSSIAFIGGRGQEIWVMGANGENSNKILTSANERYATLAWSPTGQRLAYIKTAASGNGGSIETVSLDARQPSVVISDPLLHSTDNPPLLWVRDGRIIFALSESSGNTGTNLWEIMTDPQSGKPSGKAMKLTNWDGLRAFSPSVSRDGSRLVVVKVHIRDDVYVGQLKDAGTRLDSPTRLTVSESIDYPSAWTRDSKTIFFGSNRLGRDQIFRQQLDQDTAEPLIQGSDDEAGAELSPDGAWILYWSLAHAGGGSPPTTMRLMRSPPPVDLQNRFWRLPTTAQVVSTALLVLPVLVSGASGSKVS